MSQETTYTSEDSKVVILLLAEVEILAEVSHDQRDTQSNVSSDYLVPHPDAGPATPASRGLFQPSPSVYILDIVQNRRELPSSGMSFWARVQRAERSIADID